MKCVVAVNDWEGTSLSRSNPWPNPVNLNPSPVKAVSFTLFTLKP